MRASRPVPAFMEYSQAGQTAEPVLRDREELGETPFRFPPLSAADRGLTKGWIDGGYRTNENGCCHSRSAGLESAFRAAFVDPAAKEWNENGAQLQSLFPYRR